MSCLHYLFTYSPKLMYFQPVNYIPHVYICNFVLDKSFWMKCREPPCVFEYWWNIFFRYLSIDFEYWLHLKYYYYELLMLVISLSIWYSFFLNVWKTWNPKKVRRFLWWKPLPHNIIVLSNPLFSSTVSEFFKKCFNSKQKIYGR